MQRFKSLESRIVVLFIALLLLLQLAGFVVIRSAIENNARAAIRNELMVGERVFLRLLDQNAQKLTQGARLLASDYGFRAAIASDDRETIVSVLSNHGARIGSSLAMWIGTDGAIKASTLKEPLPDLARNAAALVEQVQQGGNSANTVLINHHLFQIVAVPVKAPLTIGWVVMGFPIDSNLVADMKALSSLQVSIMVRSTDGNWKSDVSTMPTNGTHMLAEQLKGQAPDDAFLPQLQVGDNDYSARMVVLARDGGASAAAVLQRSISEAVAPYQQLQLVLLFITGLGVLIAIFGSTYTVKRITSPLRQLADIAKRLGDGDYAAHININMKRDDEIGKLALAFESMRIGISNRQAEILRLAYWDPLTDLANRVQFSDMLKVAISEARARGGSCFVLMLDLHRFQQVNDVLGHRFGDILLRQVGQRLEQQLVRSTDKVARLGGDEFAVLLPNIDLAGAKLEAKRISQSLELPISLEDQTVDLGAGIGVAGFPEHGDNADILMSRVEVAMYAAKSTGHEILVYDAGFDRSSQESLSLLGELRRALDRHEFRLYTQPKLDLASGHIVGVEALVRWVHPERGMVFPDTFIPFAESSGFVRLLTCWMLEQGAALCKSLQAQNIQLKISVNLSTRDLLDQDLPAKFAEILQRYQVGAASFCLEITESAIMGDPARAQTTLERLCEMGAELSIDDFGTGYSSLAYLKRLPVHELKIDKSFVMNMEKDLDDAKIVRSTIDLGHNMGLRVVAEGVENEAVWHLLAQMGCDQAQGYFMSKPMPVEDLVSWIQRWQAPLPLKTAPMASTVVA
jgi:diguanylate cyclase (GGDEF)-like protein